MAEEKNDQPQNAEPPKIKLNGNGKKHTDKIPAMPQAVPPRIKLETTRINLDGGTPVQVPPAEVDGRSLKSTLRIDLPGSDITETAAPTAPTAPGGALKQTSYISLPETPGAGIPKKTTARIDLSDTLASTTSPSVIKKETKRVQLPDTVTDQAAPAPVKKQTTRIDLATAPTVAADKAQETKKTTARIDLGDAIGIGNMPAEPVAPGSRQIPRTVRIKQPEMPPTIAVKKQPAGAPPATAPNEVRKSETARIELPPETIIEQPVTRRKTIRIKRPGAEDEAPTIRAPATIARTVAETIAPTAAASLETEAAPAEAAEEPGVVFAICAIAALLIVTALVYVLAVQTIAPNLPFPGKV